MTAMVDDLLVLSRIRLSKGIQLSRERVDVAALCQAAVEDASAMHPDCDYRITVVGHPEAELDNVRMHQLLVNLLGNAAQHGDRGEPVELAVDSTDAGLCFRVSNTGDEIDKDTLGTIFDPMVQLEPDDKSSPAATTSLGLGLHIAREIASAHLGEISATSADNRTTFTVCLPSPDGVHDAS